MAPGDATSHLTTRFDAGKWEGTPGGVNDSGSLIPNPVDFDFLSRLTLWKGRFHPLASSIPMWKTPITKGTSLFRDVPLP